ncbi:hypothetical protein B0H12DRAFT_1327620 [Mycena haematopus]|nr:hypothetical protein B0H12DRAFT_1327620 [Mycena haematopus]
MAAAAAFTIIDDQDPTVKYTGTWSVGGTTHEHDDTVTSSVVAGNNFLVPFTGTSIAVYGTFDASSAGVRTSYAIDGGTPVTVTSPSSPNDSYQQLFWQSDAVSSGAHNLVVTMVSVNSGDGDGEGTIWFDYFNVTSAVSTSNTSNPASNPTSSASQSASHTTGSSSTGSSSSAPSSTSTGTAVAGGSSKHTSVIAGVIVAVIVVILVAGAVFRQRRRRAAQYFAAPVLSPPPNGRPPSQFLPSQPPMTPMSGLPGSASMAPSYGAPSGASYSTGGDGFGPHQTYAMPAPGPFGQHNTYAPVPAQGFPSPAPYDPYISVGSAMLQADNTRPQSSHAPSVSSIPSSSNRGPLSVVGGSPDGSDSIAELKRRQQQVVNEYEQGISGSAPVIQHTDSGVRSLEPGAGQVPAELPPVYTAT